MIMRPRRLTLLILMLSIGSFTVPFTAAQTASNLATDLVSTVESIRGTGGNGIKGGEPSPPTDTDGDGVTDGADLCPNTPSGESVDSEGCSSSQKDSDGDGVTNDADLCPDTPSGETVDSDGCSASQRDPEAEVRQVYEDDVNALIVSAAGGCTSSGCHGRAGAPGGLRLYGAGENNSTQLNYESFLRYIESNSADKLVTKISGGSGHGGGRRYASDSPEYAIIEAWAISVEALP
jgi:hypothetical protein